MGYQSRSRRPAFQLERRRAHPDADFSVLTEHEGNGFIVSLFGELDVATAPRLEKQLKRLQWAGAAAIVVDLSGLDFIDSSGMHALMRAQRRDTKDRLRLLRGPRRVHRVFELTGTDDLLNFVD